MSGLFSLLLAMSSPAEVYSMKCAGCHGVKAEGRAGFSPKLAGQHWQYLRDQIRDIKNDKRTNGNSPMMKPFFKDMSSKSIEKIAKYLEGLNERY